MAHVFISYSREDHDFVENLCNRLRGIDIDPWADTDRIDAGTEWRREVDEGLLGAKAVVVVLSPESTHSNYVTYEWAFAIGADIPVIPILLRPTDRHPRLEPLHYFDFTSAQHRPWESLLQRLRGLPGAPERRRGRSRQTAEDPNLRPVSPQAPTLRSAPDEIALARGENGQAEVAESPSFSQDPKLDRMARRILAYLRDQNWKLMSFESIRRNINPNYSDALLLELIDQMPEVFRTARDKNQKPSLARLI